MAFCVFAVRRLGLQQKHFRSMLSASSRLSLQPHISASSFSEQMNSFSQTFRRTLLTPSHTLSHVLYFSTLQPSSILSLSNPIEFNDLGSKNSHNDILGAIELVELVRKTKDFTSRKDAIDFLACSGVKPYRENVYLATWALRNDWELALLAFELNAKWGNINEKVLGLIVWVLGSHQKFDIAWSLIRDAHLLVDTRQAILVIIERYAAANHHEKAIKTFHFMEKLTVSPDRNAFYTVISALCRYGNVEEAEEFMLKNKKLFPLETEGFNIILHGWCDISVDVVEAKRVWREMVNYCITPDAVSYTYMISCFSRVGNLFDSLRLYDEMKKTGWVPGLEVYNSLIYVMAHEKCLRKALKILNKIEENGLRPDSRSYNCLICSLCDAGKFEEARNLLVSMTQKGAQPTLETYTAFLGAADLESTLEILTRMKNDDVGPDSSTFLLIFDRFFKLREPENALKVWVEMRHYRVHPESTHYISLICGLANCGCVIKAKELHTEMISNGFSDDPKLKKLLQGPEQGSHRGRVRPMNIMRRVESKSTRTHHIRPNRERKKRSNRSSKKKQRVEGLTV